LGEEVKIKHCRACNEEKLVPILSLDNSPLANALLTKEQLAQPEPTYPLELVFCSSCNLVQITETVPPEQLFREYLYFSSFSDTVLQNAQQIVERLVYQRILSPNNLVIEIASNDGYLLQYYQARGIPVLGIEPALNIARVAQQRGIPTLAEFFNQSLAQELLAQGKLADVIHANNVLAHAADLTGLVSGIETVLKEDGVAVIEVPYVKDLIDFVEFDTIYHEHLCYFSLTSVDALFRKQGLAVTDVERIPIHGGSLRLFIQHLKGDHPISDSVSHMLTEEVNWGVRQQSFYQDFGLKVKRLRQDLLDCLYELRASGKRIAAYGASAKGTTLLNYFGIGAEFLDYVVDRSTVKQGLYTPGTHLPILSPEELLRRKPDFVLLLTWNFADEILAQQAQYRAQGGKFIIPIPQVRIV
jgi:SAM-dependent methyltransferase